LGEFVDVGRDGCGLGVTGGGGLIGGFLAHRGAPLVGNRTAGTGPRPPTPTGEPQLRSMSSYFLGGKAFSGSRATASRRSIPLRARGPQAGTAPRRSRSSATPRRRAA